MSEKPLFSQRYKAYVLLVLTGVYTFNFIDRQILVIIQESIKGELGLSDTQLGLLTGFAFAVFYVTLGLPIARYADKNNRRNVVAVSLAIWSGMTAISGTVANYIQLLLARIGVGVGEAGGSPPAHSMISDYFPAHQRATALSIYSVGIYVGILAGYSIGGWIDATYGWRMAFYALGIPGIIYALLLFITVKEPPKGHSDNKILATSPVNNDHSAVSPIDELEGKSTASTETSFWDVVQELLSKKTFVYIAIGCGFHTFGNYGVGNFFAPFLARVHSMPVQEIGVALGLTSGFGGIIGTFAGGYLADKYGQKDIRAYMWVPIVAGLLNFPFSYYAFFGTNINGVLFTYFLTALLTALYLGPSIAVTHNLVDAKKRALASAILFLFLNFIGLGLGPLVIGMISDALTPTYGATSLKYAFTSTWVTGAISLVCFYLASKTYLEEALIKKVVKTKSASGKGDMQTVLNIVLGVFLLFIVGLFFLQMGLAGTNIMSLSIWILALVGIFFAGGVYYTAKGVLSGE